MNLADAKRLNFDLIEKNKLHQDYAHTVEIADKLKKMITGKDIDSLLRQFVSREDEKMFAQRVRLTKSITPAVANKIKKPFYKVTKNKKVTKGYEISNKTQKEVVDLMVKAFYGDTKKENSGLDGFMRTRFTDLTFTDPNSWLVVEWSAPKDQSKSVIPRPFLVSASEAVNFEVKNGVTQWLLVKNDHKYLKIDALGGDNKPKFKEVTGAKYTHYGIENTITYTQVDKDYFDKNIELTGTQELKMIGDNRYFIVESFEPKLKFCPAFRIGYERDLYTDARTFVSPLEPAMPYFEKLIERVSELDLTMKLHTFPQKIQYARKCKGVHKTKKCLAGKTTDGSTCTNCKGTGYDVHTTAQDIILIPMPDDKDEMMDLSKLIHYSIPNESIVNIQREYVKDLSTDAVGAIFNSDVFVNPKINKTATQSTIDMDSVYDTLAPFAEQYSDIWRSVVSVFVSLANFEPSKAKIIHSFPSDLKLKTPLMLLEERKIANDSGAPSFWKDAIDEDLAQALNADNPHGLVMHEVKRSFYPFLGKSEDEIAIAVASEHVTRFDKVLYWNFEKIFAELNRDDKSFWYAKYEDQWKKVGEKVNEIIKTLEEGQADRFGVNDLTGANATKKEAGTQGTGGDDGANAGNE